MKESIENFINENFKEPSEYIIAFVNISKLKVFLKNNNIVFDEESKKNIANNPLFFNTLNTIFEGDVSQISKVLSSSKHLNVFLECFSNADMDESIEVSNDSISKDITDDIYNDYMKLISSYPLLSHEETTNLFIRLKHGDNLAEEKLINSNIRLVVSIAKRYLNKGVEFIDLIQEGSIGLMKAISRYDVEKGISFSTYATWWIRQAIIRSIDEKARLIRLPSYICERLRQYRKTKAELENKLNREASEAEISNAMQISHKELETLLRVEDDIMSLNDIITEDGEVEFGDIVGTSEKSVEDQVLDSKFIQEIDSLLESMNLRERELEIIRLRYGFYDRVFSCEEVGQIFNLSKQRVHQIEKNALLKIRRSDKVIELLKFSYNSKEANELVKKARYGRSRKNRIPE